MTQRTCRLTALLFLTATLAVAQKRQIELFQQQKQASFKEMLQQPAGVPPPQHSLAPLSGMPLRKWTTGSQGRWWSNPQTAEAVGLTADQVKKMDDIFQQHRLKLIDLNASLDKEEAILEPLVSADQPDDTKVVAQIDRVAQARAELEKANSRMLWSIRRVLSPEQWKKLQTYPPKPRLKM
jgi:Spy/CpxP family protein refolding chaperone